MYINFVEFFGGNEKIIVPHLSEQRTYNTQFRINWEENEMNLDRRN